MKKILAIVMSALLCLSLFMFAGCGSAFDASYTETDAAAVSQIVTKAEAAEEGTKIDYLNGVKIVIDIDMKMTAADKTESVVVKSNMVMAKVDDKLAMSGDINANSTDSKINGKVYYSDGYLYANGVYQDKNVKMKQAMPIDAFIGEFSNGQTRMMDIKTAFASVANIEGVKYYTAEKDGNTYVKFAYDVEKMGKSEIYFIFNSDYNLIGFKVEGTSSMSYGNQTMEAKMLVSMEPYSGTVNLPSDLDTYEEGQF